MHARTVLCLMILSPNKTNNHASILGFLLAFLALCFLPLSFNMLSRNRFLLHSTFSPYREVQIVEINELAGGFVETSPLQFPFASDGSTFVPIVDPGL